MLGHLALRVHLQEVAYVHLAGRQCSEAIQLAAQLRSGLSGDPTVMALALSSMQRVELLSLSIIPP